MDVLELMKSRHSVRQYLDAEIEPEKRATLGELVARINAESGLNVQILYDEPECFRSFSALCMRFSGVKNYVALVGKNSPALDEVSGYFGEQIVLKAQELGLNTCWVGLTRGKTAAVARDGERLSCAIALGYGANQGKPRRDKPLEKLCSAPKDAPEWFRRGMEAALLAPTAMNQQKFFFELKPDGSVEATCGRGFFAKMSFGIVKYHFELASGVRLPRPSL